MWPQQGNDNVYDSQALVENDNIKGNEDLISSLYRRTGASKKGKRKMILDASQKQVALKKSKLGRDLLDQTTVQSGLFDQHRLDK